MLYTITQIMAFVINVNDPNDFINYLNYLNLYDNVKYLINIST